MKRKKHFVSPRVLCQVEVCLEGDLLVIGGSTEYETDVINDGIQNQTTDGESDLIDVFYD
jgi:hypothetical protein